MGAEGLPTVAPPKPLAAAQSKVKLKAEASWTTEKRAVQLQVGTADGSLREDCNAKSITRV